MSVLTKKFNAVKEFIVFAHDLRTKDETSEFNIKPNQKMKLWHFFLRIFRKLTGIFRVLNLFNKSPLIGAKSVEAH